MLTRAKIVGFAALEQENNAVRPKILPIVVLLCAGSCAPEAPGPGRLLLSNPDFPLINVEAVITANADCDARDDGYVSTLEFAMPNNATKFIDVPAGANVCWRRGRYAAASCWPETGAIRRRASSPRSTRRDRDNPNFGLRQSRRPGRCDRPQIAEPRDPPRPVAGQSRGNACVSRARCSAMHGSPG